MAEGVAQAQLVTVALTGETCENEPYTENGYDIPVSELTVGTATYDRNYEYHVPELYGYDRLTTLDLTVWPVYQVNTSKMFHGELPVIDGWRLKDGENVQLVEGENTLNYLSVHDCDSIVTLYAMLCPYSV